jgi:hypothetical protein
MSYEATKLAWAYTREHPELSSHEALVMLALADRLNTHTGQLNPSVRRLALDCHCSETKVKESLARFVEMGLLEKVSGGGRVSNKYVLLIHNPGAPRPGRETTGSRDDLHPAASDLAGGRRATTNQERTIEKEPAPIGGADLRIVVSKEPDYGAAAAAMHEVVGHLRKKWGMPA